MSKILLIEPNYRSKFPPLGLLKIGAFHRQSGDEVLFARGEDLSLRLLNWDRIYVSSLFTWELPRTIQTLQFYSGSVNSSKDLIVGGIGVTLMPDYIRSRVGCKIVTGPLNRGRLLGPSVPALDSVAPDYSLLDECEYEYKPGKSFFTRTTQGCIRTCSFCAVAKLEPRFYYVRGWSQRLEEVAQLYGERQHLVLLDNNVLAAKANLGTIISKIGHLGFQRGATLNSKKRKVDFNQGIDARLITKRTAKLLSKVNLEPVRLAFDSDKMEKAYTRAIAGLADVGFKRFTNYVMYNFDDSPESFYYRLKKNFELASMFDVAITGFPMRFAPITSVDRGSISDMWTWKQLRGVRCILNATLGLVSTNVDFFNGAFGQNFDEFREIIAMPDRYIVFRKQYADSGATDWRRLYRRLSHSSKAEFQNLLGYLKDKHTKTVSGYEYRRFGKLLHHYYTDKVLKVG